MQNRAKRWAALAVFSSGLLMAGSCGVFNILQMVAAALGVVNALAA